MMSKRQDKHGDFNRLELHDVQVQPSVEPKRRRQRGDELRMPTVRVNMSNVVRSALRGCKRHTS